MPNKEQYFLISINGTYVRSINEGKIRMTISTDKAMHIVGKEEAITICDELRRTGHPFAVVTTLRGDLVNPRGNIKQPDGES